MGVRYSYVPKKCPCGLEIHPSIYIRKSRINRYGEPSIIRMGKKELLKKKFCSRECRKKYGSFNLTKGHTLNVGRVFSEKSKEKIGKSNHLAYLLGKRRLQQKESHWNWQGGITDANRLERARFNSCLKEKILERDNYTCQICNQVGGLLQVDHIKDWSSYPDLRFEEKNCRTLCMACHYYITFKKNIPSGIIWGNPSSGVTKNALT